MTEPYYNPKRKYKITFHIGNQVTMSSEIYGIGEFLKNNIEKKREWIIIMSTSDDYPDLFIRQSEVTNFDISEVKL